MDENQKIILLKWRARCKRAQLAHNFSANNSYRKHRNIGFFLIFLTTIASVLTFAKPPKVYSIVPIISSVLATILASFQTFMKFSEQAETHRAAARRYGEIKKEIEYVLNFLSEAENLPQLVNEIRKKEAEIGQETPNARVCDWEHAVRRTKDENEKFSIRNQKDQA